MQANREPRSFVSRQVEFSRLFFLVPPGGRPGDDPAPQGVVGEDLTVVFGGFERCQPDYRIDRRVFPWYCLEYVDRGRGRLHIGQGQYDIGPGSFYLYGPHQAHRILSSEEHPLRKYFVGFSGQMVAEILAGYGVGSGWVARCIKSDAIRLAFEMLIDRGVRKSPLAGRICSLITRQILAMCRDDAAVPADVNSPAFVTYSQARDLIEEGFLRFGTQEAVAAACGVDPAYLCRLFSRFHDESPYRFLTRVRMEYASRILLEGVQSVKGVAAELGFKDSSHFSRVFKSVHHVPPSRFCQAAG